MVQNNVIQFHNAVIKHTAYMHFCVKKLLQLVGNVFLSSFLYYWFPRLPANNFLVSLKVFAIAPQIPKK